MNGPQHEASPHAAARFLAARDEETRRRAAAWEVSLKASLPRLCALLEERGVRRVYLFGSVADGTVHEQSDIDLAVEGLPEDRYFETLAALLQAAPTGVDLVELERAPPSLRELVLGTGCLLFEARRCCRDGDTTP